MHEVVMKMNKPLTSDASLLSISMPLGAILTLIALSLTVSIGNQAQALPYPIFGPLDHSYNLTIDNKSYPIRYGFSDDRGVRLEDMTADYNAKTITVKINDENADHVADNSITDWQKRLILIELPRNVINSNTSENLGGECNASDGSTVKGSEHDMAYNIMVSSILDDNTTSPFSGHLNGDQCGQD